MQLIHFNGKLAILSSVQIRCGMRITHRTATSHKKKKKEAKPSCYKRLTEYQRDSDYLYMYHNIHHAVCLLLFVFHSHRARYRTRGAFSVFCILQKDALQTNCFLLPYFLNASQLHKRSMHILCLCWRARLCCGLCLCVCMWSVHCSRPSALSLHRNSK